MLSCRFTDEIKIVAQSVENGASYPHLLVKNTMLVPKKDLTILI